MADGPWRCSQCGTVNEPVANACRTCGRWPSLFELEGGTIDTDAPVVEDDPFAAQSVEIEQLEPQVDHVEGIPEEVPLPPEFDADEEEASRTPKPLWQRAVSMIVPIAVVLYILISALANRG